jgi:hypothetical protein
VIGLEIRGEFKNLAPGFFDNFGLWGEPGDRHDLVVVAFARQLSGHHPSHEPLDRTGNQLAHCRRARQAHGS